jgi:hypothetical protein
MNAFVKRVEDFVCEHCGAHMRGDGFTNHCSECLWSKHVDQTPGDRAEVCHGLMKPTDVFGSTPEYKIVHTCEKCGAKRTITARPEDATALIAWAQKRSLL